MNEGNRDSDHTRLLASIAEQLKVPLMTIARQAELGQLTGQTHLADLSGIRTHADAALVLVDSYLLGLQLMRSQTTLDLEPVSVSSTLVEIAHELERFAKQYEVRLEVHIGGRYEPVMAHPVGLKAALLSLGYGLVEAQAATDTKSITLATHRTPHGIVAGLYGAQEPLATSEWRTALALCGQATQPFTGLSASSGAGIFVAHTILQAMETKLRVGKRLRQYGLATTLQPSQQLQFV